MSGLKPEAFAVAPLFSTDKCPVLAVHEHPKCPGFYRLEISPADNNSWLVFPGDDLVLWVGIAVTNQKTGAQGQVVTRLEPQHS